MPTQFPALLHPRKISEITDGEVSIWGTSDGGTTWYPVTLDTSGNLLMRSMNNLITEEFDYIALTYTGTNLTGVVYKTGGSGGSTVATVTLAYTGNRLDSVTKT